MGLSSTEVCRPELCSLHEIHCVTMCHTLKCLGRPLTSFDLWRSAATICNSKNSHISTIMLTSQRPVQSAKIVTLFWIRATFVVIFMVGFGCLSVKHAAGILMFITQEAARIEALCPGHSCYESDPEDCYQPSRSSQTHFWFVNILYMISYICYIYIISWYHIYTEWQLDCADMSCLQRAGWHGQMSNQGRPCNSL